MWCHQYAGHIDALEMPWCTFINRSRTRPLGGASGPLKIFFIEIKNWPPEKFFMKLAPGKIRPLKIEAFRPRKFWDSAGGLLVVIGSWNLCRNDRF